jgi:hypothetical protein
MLASCDACELVCDASKLVMSLIALLHVCCMYVSVPEVLEALCIGSVMLALAF